MRNYGDVGCSVIRYFISYPGKARSFVMSIASRSQAESEPYCHTILFVWMSVGHSATYSLPRLVDHNQIWSAGIYLSSDPWKPFWIPYLPYFRCQREKYARILAPANVMHRAI